MSDEINFLLTLLSDGTLVRVAVKYNGNRLPGDCAECPMEPENREILHGLLPDHIREIGPIVDVEPILEIAISGR